MRGMILGVAGMLGSAMFRILKENKELSVYGTARSESTRAHFQEEDAEKITTVQQAIDYVTENAWSFFAEWIHTKRLLMENGIGSSLEMRVKKYQ